MVATGMDLATIKKWVAETIDSNGELLTEYFEIADAGTLQPVAGQGAQGSARGFIAVKAGDVRLIDNIKL